MDHLITVEMPDGSKRQYDLGEMILFLFQKLPQKEREEFYNNHYWRPK